MGEKGSEREPVLGVGRHQGGGREGRAWQGQDPGGCLGRSEGGGGGERTRQKANLPSPLLPLFLLPFPLLLLLLLHFQFSLSLPPFCLPN